MALAAGTKLGSYEILAPIGAGGMGEVYRARDTTLKRDVALKVLPSDFSDHPEREARFQREAEVLASLDHPNIGPIHGIVESGGARALALALIEGPTLADRIAAGPVPPEEALAIARQIIDALEYAHERGVVHRDLKPGNVKINSDGVVKVLDFGLAKVLEDEPPASLLGASPTLTLGHTRAGMILGTAAYMSPEQAVGRPVDRRTDIFSFGAVLYEMLTGLQAFAGNTAPDLLEAVVKSDPDWSKLPQSTVPAVRKLLRRCLVKDRKQRLQAIGEARILLNEREVGPEGPPQAQGPPPENRVVWWKAGAAVLAVALAGVSWIAYRATRPAEFKSLVRLNLDLPSTTFALSPDGARIVYCQPSSNSAPLLATRLLADSGAAVLQGTDNGRFPFFSPDGQWIGFLAANGQLQKVSIRGGAPVSLTTASVLMGATWGKDGSIIAALDVVAPLSRISDAGGAPEEIVSRAEAGNALGLSNPQYLPGGRAVLFAATGGDAPGIYMKNLVTRKTRRLLENSTFARYLPTSESAGHIVYVNQGTLFARPFDPGKPGFLGPPQPVISDLAAESGGYLPVSFSESGELLYQMGHASRLAWPVYWMDSSGVTRPLFTTEGYYSTPRFSPDPAGQFLALVSGEGLGQILVYDWKNDITATLTKGSWPIWSPDGRHLAFANNHGIGWVRSDGSGEPYQILERKNVFALGSISPDGRYLAFSEVGADTLLDVWVAPLDLSNSDRPVLGKPQLVVGSRGQDVFPMFSPDGKWLAYFSDESGRYEVYVRPFPGPGAARSVSAGVGIYPVWSSNGHELLFSAGGGPIMVVEYHVSGDAFIANRPRVWSSALPRQVGTLASWALHPDGKRVAMFPRDAENDGAPRLAFLLNFFDELRRRVPVGK